MHMTDWANNVYLLMPYVSIAKPLYCTCNFITVNSINGYHIFYFNNFFC